MKFLDFVRIFQQKYTNILVKIVEIDELFDEKNRNEIEHDLKLNKSIEFKIYFQN